MLDRPGDGQMYRPRAPLVSVADIIAATICEFDGRDWRELDPWQRAGYIRVACVAQDRIRVALEQGSASLG